MVRGQATEIGAGAPIAIEVAGVEGRFMTMSSQLDVEIEVTNLSGHAVTVDRIQVRKERGAAFAFSTIDRRVNELLADGEDHNFPLRTDGQLVRNLEPAESRKLVLRVTVTLTDGDSYFGLFEVPIIASGY